MKNLQGRQACIGSFITALTLCLGAASARAADVYNVANHQLTSPSLSICNVTYSNMVMTIGAVTGGPVGNAPNSAADSFNPGYNELIVPAVSVGAKTFFNVIASVSGLVSIGSVTGADTYDGTHLTIPSVQVGAAIYNTTVVRVGTIVSVGGGMPKGIRDLYNIESGRLFIPVVVDSVHGRTYTNLTVTVASIVSLGSQLAAPPSCGSLPALTAGQVNRAAASVQTYYQSLTHGSQSVDIVTVAGYMVQSGLFSTAQTVPGGIAATMPDGTTFSEFADRIEDFCSTPSLGSTGLTCASGATGGAGSPGGNPDATVGPSNPHEIAFLVNMSGDPAFDPSIQTLFAGALQNAGFTAPNFGVDVLDVTLDNIASLGSDHPLDLLHIATHGLVYSSSPSPLYHWLSDTPVTDVNNATYASDVQKNRVHYGAILYNPIVATAGVPGNGNAAFYTFTPAFLANHVKLNSGAILDNESSYAQLSGLSSTMASTFPYVLGYYLGWDDAMNARDANQTEAFLFDRLLGEANTTELATLVTQRTPQQRPFPLTDVLFAMRFEVRSPVTWTAQPTNSYLLGAPSGGNTRKNVNFVASPVGSPKPVPIDYALPSISNMYVTEASTGGTLTVVGTFPSTAGKGQIADTSGTYPLSPSSWTPTQIQFPLPPGGNGAAGLVTVFSADGIPSNPVPLTEWKGQLTVTVNPVLSNMNGIQGSGGGSVTAVNTFDFRADVHPVVTAIDTAPVPQNFAVLGELGDSTMSLTAADVSFKSSNGAKSAQWTLAQPPSVLTPSYTAPTLSPGSFIFAPNVAANEPATCNSGVPGPQSSGPTTVFCPYGGAWASAALVCSDNGGGLCKTSSEDFAGYYGYPPWVAVNPADFDGVLVFTLNPVSYAVTFTSQSATLIVNNYSSSEDHETITLSATIQQPLYAPGATTPAVIGPPASVTISGNPAARPAEPWSAN
jgi:hypothetical protein